MVAILSEYTQENKDSITNNQANEQMVRNTGTQQEFIASVNHALGPVP